MSNITKQQLNLQTLRRHDPRIQAVTDATNQSAVYAYEGGNWEKLSIEGTLFVVERSQSPRFALIILNRLGVYFYFKNVN